MSISLLPFVRTEKLTDIQPAWLKQQNIRLLMLDFDNTIVPYTTAVPQQAVIDWFRTMNAADIPLCVVSNSRNDRVKKFCAAYGLDCITHAKKPFPKGIRACLARYGIPAAHCAIVGDQIFTDTLGGNGCGVKPILVRPIDNHNFWLKARHVLEQPFIYLARKRRIAP